jgi:hypothetical protein
VLGTTYLEAEPPGDAGAIGAFPLPPTPPVRTTRAGPFDPPNAAAEDEGVLPAASAPRLELETPCPITFNFNMPKNNDFE